MRRVRQERGEPRPLGFQLGALHAGRFHQSGGRPGLVLGLRAAQLGVGKAALGRGQLRRKLGDAPLEEHDLFERRAQ